MGLKEVREICADASVEAHRIEDAEKNIKKAKKLLKIDTNTKSIFRTDPHTQHLLLTTVILLLFFIVTNIFMIQVNNKIIYVEKIVERQPIVNTTIIEVIKQEHRTYSIKGNKEMVCLERPNSREINCYKENV